MAIILKLDKCDFKKVTIEKQSTYWKLEFMKFSSNT